VLSGSAGGFDDMKKLPFFCLALMAFSSQTSASFAEDLPGSSPMFAKIDAYAEFAFEAGVCSSIGYNIDSSKIEAFGKRVETESIAAGISTTEAARMMNDALARKESLLKSHGGMPNTEGKTPVEMVREIDSFLLRYRRICDERASSAEYGDLFTPVSKPDLDQHILELRDGWLRPIGYASWQNATMRAQADITEAAGVCRFQIGQARHDALIKPYLSGPAPSDPRAREYLSEWHNIGLQQAAELDLTLAQCNRLIAGREAALMRMSALKK
jgi:hypothetical protein